MRYQAKAGNGLFQRFKVHRLGDVRVKALALGALGVGGAAIAGHGNGAHACAQLRLAWQPAQRRQQRIAVHAGHADVRNQQFVGLVRQQLQRRSAAGGRVHLRALVLQHHGKQPQRVLHVVHQQQAQPLQRPRCRSGRRRRRAAACQRQPHREHGPLAQALGHHGHFAALRQAQFLHQGQPDAQPALVHRGGAALRKHAKHLVQVLGCNADAGVGHAQLGKGAALGQRQRHPHAAAGGRELDGVVQQVPDNLLDPHPVAPQLHLGRRALPVQRHALAHGVGAGNVHDGFHRFHAHGLQPQLQLAGACARQVQQVVDQLGLAAHGAADVVAGTLRQRHAAQFGQVRQQLGADLDQVQRVLQLVRHHRQKLVLERIGGARFGVRLLLALQQRLAFGLQRLAAGQVAGNLDKTGRFAVAQLRHHAAAVKGRAVLAQVPALVFGAAGFACAAHFCLGHALGAVLGREKQADVPAQHLCVLVAECAPCAFVPERDQTIVVQRHDDVVARGQRRQAQPLLTGNHKLFGLAQLGHIDKRQHRAGNLVVVGAVGAQARQVVAPLGAAHRPLDGVQLAQHGADVRLQFVVLQPVRDVQQQPVDVAGNQVEQQCRLRREALDAHCLVDEQRGNVGRCQEVLQVVVALAGFLDAALELVVDRHQLLVHRLQFFLAGFQLLGGRAQFLVDRLQLLVRGLEFLGRDVGMLDRVAQVVLELADLGFKLRDQLAAQVVLRQGFFGGGRFAVLEGHQHHWLGRRRGRHPRHPQARQALAAGVVKADAAGACRLAGLRQLKQRRAQLDAQRRVDARQQFGAQRAAALLQVASGTVAQVQYVELVVGQQAGR